MKSISILLFCVMCSIGLFLLPSFAFGAGMTLGEVKDQYAKALRSLKRGKSEKATHLFYELTKESAAPVAYRRRALYQLSVSFYRQKLYVASLRYLFKYLRTSKRRRSGYFIRSLIRMMELGEKLENEKLIRSMLWEIPLLRIVPKKGKDPFSFLTSFVSNMKRLVQLLERKKRPKRAMYIKRFISQIERLKNGLAYHLGYRFFTLGRYPYAYLLFRRIKPSGSEHYFARSRVLYGIMRMRLGDSLSSRGKFLAGAKLNLSAIRNFQTVLKIKPSLQKNIFGKIPQHPNKWLFLAQRIATFGIPRAYYALGFNLSAMQRKKKQAAIYLRKALALYDKINTSTIEEKATVLFEKAYCFWLLGKYNQAIPLMEKLHRFTYRSLYVPEYQLTLAIVYYAHTKFAKARKVIAAFWKRNVRILKALQKMIAKGKKLKWRAAYYHYYKEQSAFAQLGKKTALPQTLLKRLPKNAHFRAWKKGLHTSLREQAMLKKRKSSWKKSSLGKEIEALYRGFDTSLKRRFGKVVLLEFKGIHRKLDRLLKNGSFVKLESLRRERMMKEKK